MGAFTWVAYLDTWELACSLRPRMNLFREGAEPGTRILRVRFADNPEDEALHFKHHKEFARWTELRTTASRIQRLADATPYGPTERGDIFCEMLEPGATLDWQPLVGPYHMRHARLHLPLRTNPRAMMYAGPEALHMLPGSLHVVSAGVPLSAVNLGEWQRIHLVVDLRKKELPPEEGP